MGKVLFVYKFICYKLFAKHKKGFGIHSPFVFNLLTKVIENNNQYYAFDSIELLKQRLLDNQKTISVTDYGAGSTKLKNNIRKISEIARISSQKEKYGRLLFRLVEHFKPEQILELGTSLGIGTLYLAMPNSNSNLYTIEGCPEIAAVAKENFKQLKVQNIQLLVGSFDEQLPKLLKEVSKLDFVFFDGNHRKEPTLSYFEQCLPLAHENTVFVFDDIHWSKEMDEAWQIICNNSRTVICIDLFFMGLVFFKKGIPKQNFVINF